MGAAAVAMALLYLLDLGIKLNSMSKSAPASTPKPYHMVVLRLPHLEDFEKSFPEIVSDPTLEMMLFNDDRLYFFQFLNLIRLHNLSPDSCHNLVLIFLSHLKKTYSFPDDDTVFIFLQETFGASLSMRVVLDARQFPGALQNLSHTIRLKVLNLPTTGQLLEDRH